MVTYNYSEKVCIYTYIYTRIYVHIYTHTLSHTHMRVLYTLFAEDARDTHTHA